jgi:hypothetical protein
MEAKMAAIPIISEVISLVNSAVDKIWPDADTKEKAKVEMQGILIQQAMESNKLLFQDTEGARDLFKAELEVEKTPQWSRAFQVLARPFCMYSCISMYVWVKIAPIFKAPTIVLTDWDYYLIGTIFVFLFGARSLEKLKGKA